MFSLFFSQFRFQRILICPLCNQLTIHRPLNLNVNKILCNIQKKKSISTNKKISDPSKKFNSSKKSKKKIGVSMETRIEQNEWDTFKDNSIDNPIESSKSFDIFEDLELTNVDDLMDNYKNIGEDYEIYEDSFMTRKNLLSYIHLCIYNDQLYEAQSFLMEFVGKFSNSLSSDDIVSCCELLIKGTARKGNTENVRELMAFIKNYLKKKLSFNVYESYLLTLCKEIKESCSKEDIMHVLEEMRKDNFDPKYLFQKSHLNSSEIQIIKNVLNKNNIHIDFKKYKISKKYNNELVDKILVDSQKYYNPFEGIDLSNMDELIEKQFDFEINSPIKIKPIDAQFHDLSLGNSASFCKNLINKLENDWKISLTNAFDNYLKSLRKKHKRLNGIPFIYYMTILEPENYVDFMLEEIRKCASFSENYSPFSFQLFESLGRKIMFKYIIRSNMMDGSFLDFKECYKQYVKYTLNPDLIQKYNPREYWQYLMQNGYHYYLDPTKYWTKDILKEIGNDLYDIISSETKFDTNILKINDLTRNSIQPVISFFYKSHDTFKTKKEIRVNPLLIQIYEKAGSEICFESEKLPLLSPPVPWINVNFGGNLLNGNFFIRSSINYPKYRFKNFPIKQLYPTFDSLNALSLCPWKINERILDIAIDIFQKNGNLDLDIPVSLANFGPLPKSTSEMTTKERALINYKRKLQKKEQAEMYSLWMDCLYKLSIGNSLRGKYFWFPINTDFRSRVYPIPPNFNHLGNDLSRAILLFGKGKPLGKEGLKWLKIHLINLTGLKKKCSVEERLNYADEIIDLIMDSADKPLNGKLWWMKSDEKWQTLACCIELTNALRSQDPYSYISHMPIHQDGSCNGLQHYAALGRDILGAKSVNLVPCDYPQDVYSDVVSIVEAEIEKDSKNNMEIANIIKGYITRKIVKQTVMTYVYGVTRYGAKLQVLKQLKDDPNFPELDKVAASVYISEKILFSIRQMFKQTRQIQDWLTRCAHIISTDYNETVEWVTPLGFPVIQSYYKIKKKNCSMLIPNVLKQKNGFPANFIHSLDSSHMMLTSLECHRHGLTFSSVHDCYWTHACNIDQMNYFCRKQFISLHSEPILNNLGKFLREKLEYYNRKKNIPHHLKLVKQVERNIPQGEFDINSVIHSVYFFS